MEDGGGYKQDIAIDNILSNRVADMTSRKFSVEKVM